MSMHHAIADVLKALQLRYPDQNELTLDEFADYMGVSRKYVTQLINIGKIPHLRYSRTNWRILITDLALWLAQKRIDNGIPIRLTREDMKRNRGYRC